MRLEERISLQGFLRAQPDMCVRPSPPGALRVEGEFHFLADYEGGPEIEDSFHIRITVSRSFPKVLPRVEELDGRIPRHIDNHVYPDGALCLGSTFQLYLIANETQDLKDFAQLGLVPYLYAAAYREQFGGTYPFGELRHGKAGLLDDYARILELNSPEQAAEVIALLALKRRLANKRPCPCGCKRRLGVCAFNERIRALRAKFGRPLFKRLHNQVLKN